MCETMQTPFLSYEVIHAVSLLFPKCDLLTVATHYLSLRGWMYEVACRNRFVTAHKNKFSSFLYNSVVSDNIDNSIIPEKVVNTIIHNCFVLGFVVVVERQLTSH